MAEQTATIATGAAPTPQPGSAGINTQVGGQPTTVSAAGQAAGMGAGEFIEVDIDDELFRFKSEDTPLMNLMLKAKKVKVNSPEVQHYMLDEPRSEVKTTSAVTANANANQFSLPLLGKDQKLLQAYGTVICKGVNGYDPTGQTATNTDLMLFVKNRDNNGNPIVYAVNGPKASASDELCTVPAIPANTVCVILGNALYETQKKVQPDLIVPQPELLFLQKRGMNQVVSDYFESQKKRIPFAQALIAEQAITNFKTRGNRTLWVGQQGKFRVETPEMGEQWIWTTKGIRWQFKRELQHTGKWTYEQFIALAKIYYTGEDVPGTGLVLCGKNVLEGIQCIDWSKHPEVKIEVRTNKLGWKVTAITTVFGDLEFKREPTLDKLGYLNSAAILGENRLVHYQYSAEHSFNEAVEGEEAKRNGILVWDGLGLKGNCHIWIDGENENNPTGATQYELWESATAPSSPVTGTYYYFIVDCTLGENTVAKAQELWQYTGSQTGWKKVVGEING